MTGLLLLATSTSSKTTSSSSWSFILIIVVLYAAMYFLFIRPRSQRAKAQRTSARQVEVGDVVQTIGGLVATVVEVHDQTIVLRTNDGTDLEFVRGAIASKYQEAATSTAPATESTSTPPASNWDFPNEPSSTEQPPADQPPADPSGDSH